VGRVDGELVAAPAAGRVPNPGLLHASAETRDGWPGRRGAEVSIAVCTGTGGKG